MLKYFAILLWLFPAFTFAQTSSTGSLQQLLVGVGGFLNSIVVPFILAIAFIVFVFNVVRFFIIGGASDEGQKNAKNLAIYGIGAFVFILSFWGIVNLVVDGIGLENNPCTSGITSDYIKRDAQPCDPLDNPPPGGDGNSPPKDDEDPGDDEPSNPPPPEDTMAQILTAIKSSLADSVSALDNLYGGLADYVQSDLFADFLSEQQLAREEEARAIVRAAMLEMIPFSTQERFFNAWLAEQIADGVLNPIDQEEIESTLPQTLPDYISTRLEATKSDIRRQLEAYQSRISTGGFTPPPLATPDISPATPEQVLNYLFDQTININTRESYLITLIEDRYDIIDASLGDEIYNNYIDINNVITTYNARFNTLDERDPAYVGPR